MLVVGTACGVPWLFAWSPVPHAVALAPAIVALVLAFATRRPASSLLLGALVGAFIRSGVDPLAWATRCAIYAGQALLDVDHVKILAFTLCLGIVARGATENLLAALREREGTRSNSARAVQLSAWLFGLVLFVDDYLNALLVGATSRPAFDRAGVSRAKLSFLVDATAAPVSSLAPLSTWIAVELGYISDYCRAAKSEGALTVFVASLPYRFYPLLMLGFALVGIVSGREFGPMLHARASAPEALGVHAPKASTARLWVQGLLPMTLVMVLVVFFMAKRTREARYERQLDWGRALAEANALDALCYGALAGAILCLGLGGFGSNSARRVLGLLVNGTRSMLAPCSILATAWVLSASLHDLGSASVIAGLLPGAGGAAWLSAAVFVTAALTSFATGTSWGTMAIVFPVALPLAHGVSGSSLELSVVGAVLAGAVFGDHCSPVSDTTVLSAASAGCDVMHHVLTQLPYALVVGGISLLAHLLVGYLALSPWWLLGAGLGCSVAIFLWLGKRVHP